MLVMMVKMQVKTSQLPTVTSLTIVQESEEDQ